MIRYSANSVSQQLFADGEVGVGVMLNDRAFGVVKEGAPKREVAMNFMNAAAEADNRARRANAIAHLPVNPAAFAKIDPDAMPWPTNAANVRGIAPSCWRENLAELTARRTGWKLS
ncbi:hypothetical protein LNKW23_37500 [Paralimibaculum aggregatum]|uniref:Uncharacterized protein n=1 Tax=Paralimibaculum aggregatum TaxID=3036245 RepID=A0ABQ6LPS6_9RHOB|nr:hypothetical protein [Limibaculum sp. NKW23]GMG84534.1 hypothetical protein LNKW23_37500 [Limibaculum sp. NKW23]